MWRIKNWDEHYENNRSREVSEARWVPVKNQQDGDSYLALVTTETGPQHYGCFMAIALLASKCSPRGDLRQSTGIPHTPETMARKTHFAASLIHSTLHRCMDHDVDWVEWVDDPQDVQDGLFAEKPGPVAMPRRRQASAVETSVNRDPRSGSGKEDTSSTTTRARVASAGDFPCTDGTWAPEPDLIESLREKHPKLDIEAEIHAARRKVTQIPDFRKTVARMPKFLWNWMRVSEADMDAGKPPRQDDTGKALRATAPRATRVDRVLETLEKTK